MEGCDYSYDHPDPEALRKAGIRWVVRYISGAIGTKAITVAERNRLWAAGLGIVLVWETTATRALSGHAGGQQDAAHAAQMTHTLQWPGNHPVYFAVDFNPTPHELSAVVDYFRALNAGDTPFKIGAYGGYHTLGALRAERLATKWWQTSAWSQGQWQTFNDIEQYAYDVRIGGGVVDLDRASSDHFGAHYAPPGWKP